MKLLLITLTLGGCLLGQTKPKTSQLRPQPDATFKSVYVLGDDGVMRFVRIGANLDLLCPTPTTCSLVAVIPPATLPPRKVEQFKPTATTATLTLTAVPISSEIDITINGITLTAVEDYTITGTVITFLGTSQPQATDVVRVTYR